MMFQANQAVAQADQLQDSIETLNTDAADTESLIRDQVVMAERERIFIFYCCLCCCCGGWRGEKHASLMKSNCLGL